jgi:phosphoribosylglycinamide formyltransferase-1
MVLTPANVIDRYKGMMVNQHPGPLDTGRDDFGGPGMYGLRVHAARICFVSKTGHDYWSESTAQLVGEEFDTGKVIRTGRVPIFEGDTAEMLAERMLPVEHQVQLQALEDFFHNRVSIIHRPEPLVSPEEVSVLEECKKTAILMYPKG